MPMSKLFTTISARVFPNAHLHARICGDLKFSKKIHSNSNKFAVEKSKSDLKIHNQKGLSVGFTDFYRFHVISKFVREGRDSRLRHCQERGHDFMEKCLKGNIRIKLGMVHKHSHAGKG